MIPQETIDRIITNTNIVEIISEHVTLKRKGINHVGNCPFHSEKTPSFVVSSNKAIYKCFGCGASGNVVKFIQDIEQSTWIEAIRLLAKRANIELPKKDVTDEEKAAIDKRDRMFASNDFANRTFMANRNFASSYMRERGFDNADLDRFQIGYALDDFNHLKTIAENAGFNQSVLLDVGLLSQNDRGNIFDRFRARIIFPIHNHSGKIVGFTGRISSEDKTQAKYLNSPESSIFRKGDILYGLNLARTAIVREGRCNLVEGNTDVMRWHKCGVENTVATCGTALTSAHAKLIHRYTENLTIVFDGDSAGIKAATKGVDICLKEGLNVYVALLPDGEDPDSFAKDKTEKELRKWIETNEKDFILFRAEYAKNEIENKPAEKVRVISELRDSINLIPDKATRQIYFETLAKTFKTNIDAFLKDCAEVDTDLFGIEANKDAIREADEMFIYTNKENFMFDVSQGLETAIVIPGFPLRPEHIGAIEVLSKNLYFTDPIATSFKVEEEPASITDFRKLSERGFRIKVKPPEDRNYDKEYISFSEIYFELLSNAADRYDTASQKIAIEKCAEFLARQDKTTISIKTAEVAKMFGITKAAFEQVLKPFVNKQKSKTGLTNEAIVVDDQRFVFDDIDRLPDYVDRQFLNKYRHFPVQNKNGEKIFYMFQGENGQLFRVANFYMEPQFQVKHDEDKKNKRIVKLNHSELGTSKYVEIPSDHLIEFGAFKKFIWRQGPYIFRNGKPQHLDMILDSIALDFPVTNELEIYGQQEEGFYAFCNAIYANGKIEYMNELGLVDFDKQTYYSPSVSCIYKDVRKDSDKYAQDRFFIFRETNSINLHDWAKLMLSVYKHNENGYWAVIMAILSAFRSDVFKIDRLFTTLFLIGPTGCGKSELAQSIRAIFMHPDAPMFNLNSGTDAAFFTTLERFRDAPVIMEEYNDMYISDAKFQGLKAAVYDGEGKTKRKDATSKDLDQSQVNAIPIILGQESPERDDASLANRTVIRPVKKVEYWTDEETEDFQRLKKYEKLGLTNILLEILKQRTVVQKYFAKKLRLVQREFRDDLRANNQSFQPRILNTVSLFATMVKLIEEEVTSFSLPFSYANFYPIARKTLVEQSESIQQTNRLAVFFDTLMLLAEENSARGIEKNKDYKIEVYDTISVRKGRDKEELVEFDGMPTRLLFLRLDTIHPKYKAAIGVAEHLKMNNLLTYIKDHPSYVGQIKTTTFKWQEETRSPNDNGIVVSLMQEQTKRTSATVLNYDMLNDPKNPILDLGESLLKDYEFFRKQKENRMTNSEEHPMIHSEVTEEYTPPF
jgi:DNA primase catalytic core